MCSVYSTLWILCVLLYVRADNNQQCSSPTDSDCSEPDSAKKYTSEAVINKMSGNHERTFIMVKPDGVQRGLLPEILSRFTRKGFKLVALKMVQPTEEFARKHYDDLKTKPFFAGLTKFLSSGPCVAMVWEGKGSVKTGRILLGETNPLDSKPGTIRGDYAIDIGRNIIHGSDSVESADREIDLWFKKEELVEWAPTINSWVYE